MLRGLYITATGMMTQRNLMNAITNNIVNAETVGYKKDMMVSRSFEDMMLVQLKDHSHVRQLVPDVGPLHTGVYVDMTEVDYKQGYFEQTGDNAEMALSGEGFFVVDTPEGERYTRAGNFYVSSEGFLQNADGYYVQGQNGAINVGTDNFSVSTSGDVLVDGAIMERVRVVTFPDLLDMRKEGDNLYSYAGAGAAQQPVGTTVRQGYIEGSNVDIGREVADMMVVYRAYESSQKMSTMIDETLGKAVNDIGRVG